MKLKVDSRKIEKGDIFLALTGTEKDGHDYIDEAIKNGASKIICEHGNYNIPTEVVDDTRKYLLDYLKENIYPQIKDICLVGITGTNGKTTTAYLLYEAIKILNLNAAYIGTIGFYVEGKVRDLNNTTPDIYDIYDMILEAKNNNCKYVIMEVSSHALFYNRVETLLFDYAIFTNLTQDHLDFHITIDNYIKEKQKLFKKLKSNGKAIINIDDKHYKNFVNENNKNIFYGFSDSDYKITDYKLYIDRSVIKINEKDTYETELIGKYNLYNLLAAISTLTEMGFKDIDKIIKKLIPPIGRMDKIMYNDNIIIVDYAHTPDAVEKVLKNIRYLTNGNIYTVIGCGGNRDKLKRPIMGAISTNNSNYVIFTSDNPRDEEIMDIIDDMVKDINKDNYIIIPDRKEAIKKGMQLLKKNDILVVLGKGHENYQIIKGEKKYFDDKQIILEFM